MTLIIMIDHIIGSNVCYPIYGRVIILFPYHSILLLWDSHSFHLLVKLNLSYCLGKLERLRNWRSWRGYGTGFSQQTVLLDLYNIFPWKSIACRSIRHQFWNFTNFVEPRWNFFLELCQNNRLWKQALYYSFY